MNREDIIRMARGKANAILLDLIGKPEWDKGCTEQHLIEFSALVASAEREACLKFCDEVAEYFPSSGFVGSFIGSKIRARAQA